MTPRRDCGDEPVGKFDVGTRVTPPRAVTPRVALGARAWRWRVRIPFAREVGKLFPAVVSTIVRHSSHTDTR
jgi:hypothetical protein